MKSELSKIWWNSATNRTQAKMWTKQASMVWCIYQKRCAHRLIPECLRDERDHAVHLHFISRLNRARSLGTLIKFSKYCFNWILQDKSSNAMCAKRQEWRRASSWSLLCVASQMYFVLSCYIQSEAESPFLLECNEELTVSNKCCHNLWSKELAKKPQQ